MIRFSIHASAKEATLIPCVMLPVSSIFNPRLREGGDTGRKKLYQWGCFSIHASAKEATDLGGWDCIDTDVFNPRLREGGDSVGRRQNANFVNFSIHASAKEATYYYSGRENNRIFQSTPPRRRRRCYHGNKRPDGTIFNPRLREGGDHRFNGAWLYRGFSIHASAKEATGFCRDVVVREEFSIHASAKEATATYCNTPAIMCISSLNNFFVHHF